jgi:hypothetical protein
MTDLHDNAGAKRSALGHCECFLQQQSVPSQHLRVSWYWLLDRDQLCRLFWLDPLVHLLVGGTSAPAPVAERESTYIIRPRFQTSTPIHNKFHPTPAHFGQIAFCIIALFIFGSCINIYCSLAAGIWDIRAFSSASVGWKILMRPSEKAVGKCLDRKLHRTNPVGLRLWWWRKSLCVCCIKNALEQ